MDNVVGSPGGGIILRKKKMVRSLMIDRAGGQIKYDRFLLPESALVLSGVKVTARHIELEPVVMTTLLYHYGALAFANATVSQIEPLTAVAYTDTQPEFTVTAGDGEFIYYAHPASLSDPVFQYMGFQGGFLDHGTVNLNTPSGLLTYRVWRSTNANLGANVVVKAIH